MVTRGKNPADPIAPGDYVGCPLADRQPLDPVDAAGRLPLEEGLHLHLAGRVGQHDAQVPWRSRLAHQEGTLTDRYRRRQHAPQIQIDHQRQVELALGKAVAAQVVEVGRLPLGQTRQG